MAEITTTSTASATLSSTPANGKTMGDITQGLGTSSIDPAKVQASFNNNQDEMSLSTSNTTTAPSVSPQSQAVNLARDLIQQAPEGGVNNNLSNGLNTLSTNISNGPSFSDLQKLSGTINALSETTASLGLDASQSMQTIEKVEQITTQVEQNKKQTKWEQLAAEEAEIAAQQQQLETQQSAQTETNPEEAKKEEKIDAVKEASELEQQADAKESAFESKATNSLTPTYKPSGS